MELSCQHCGAGIHYDDIDLSQGLARCSHCKSVYDLAAKRRRAWSEGELPDGARVRPRVAMPDRFELVEEDGGLFIQWRWLSAKTWFLLVFSIAWNSFLVFWFSTAFSMDRIVWIMVLFPIAHVAVGLFVAYQAITGLVNRTQISVSGEVLRVRHAPLPWPGNRDMPASSLDQLYCKEVVTRTKNGGTQRRYELHALTQEGTRVKLLKRLDDLDQALFLEQQIEIHLGIRDYAVDGEVQS